MHRSPSRRLRPWMRWLRRRRRLECLAQAVVRQVMEQLRPVLHQFAARTALAPPEWQALITKTVFQTRLSPEDLDGLADRLAERTARRVVQRLRTEPAGTPPKDEIDIEAEALALVTGTGRPRRKRR